MVDSKNPNIHPIATMQMNIVKASFDKGSQQMRWRSVNSDTDGDLYGERMSLELYKDFIDRIDNNLEVPEPFKSVVCEDEWCGSKPYLSIAHFKSGTEKKNVPGEVDSVYIDGRMLKSKGILYDTDLGRTVFKALCDDLYGEKSDNSQPVRISIGFLDLEHKHVAKNGGQEFTFTRTDLSTICPLCSDGIGNKIYMKGQLVHLAMTRVPVNPRTEMEVERSMEITTKREDAKSIVGDLADVLEEKSQASDILVIKSDETNVGSDPKPDPNIYKDCYDPNTDSYNQDCMDKIDASNSPEIRNDMNAVKSDVIEDKSAHPTPEIIGNPDDPETWRIDMKDEAGNVIKSFTVTSIEKAGTEEPMKDEKVKEDEAVKGEVKEKSQLTAYEQLEAKKAELKSKNIVGDEALKELQPIFNALGKEVTEEFSVPVEVQNVQILEELKNLSAANQALALQVAELAGKAGSGEQVHKSNVPRPRSLALKPEDYLMKKSQNGQAKELSQIQKIARSSVGLSE